MCPRRVQTAIALPDVLRLHSQGAVVDLLKDLVRLAVRVQDVDRAFVDARFCFQLGFAFAKCSQVDVPGL